MPLDAETERDFNLRWKRYAPQIRTALAKVYPGRETEVEARLAKVIKEAMAERPAELRELDEERILRPDWLQQPEMIGYVAYADRFAGSLRGVAEHVDYLKGLGVTYLHVMPFLKPREGANDGGYAVQDYRQVRPDLGTMDDLEALAATLRENGISLEMDLVLNHVAKEHEWAEKAREGDPKYRDYFLLYPDRKMPDEFEKTLPEIFPDFAPGNFTWNDAANAWVWTTFNEYQWDLNWANPEVLYEFVELICWLANKGVAVFRLDAIAFIWKRLGTNCQNQPEVHDVTQVLRGCLRVAAPAVAFKAEAIVAPEDLMPYLGVRQHHGLVSDMAYHNELMVQLWNSIATGEQADDGDVGHLRQVPRRHRVGDLRPRRRDGRRDGVRPPRLPLGLLFRAISGILFPGAGVPGKPSDGRPPDLGFVREPGRAGEGRRGARRRGD